MKKNVSAVLTAGVIAVSTQAFAIGGAGVIVHDAQQSVKTAAQWVKEAKQWTNELKAYQDELLAKTGIRDVQGLIQDAQSISSDLTEIYNEGESFYTDYVQNPEGVLSPKAKAILDKYQVGKTCLNKGFSGDALKGCEAKFLSDLATVEYGDNLKKHMAKDNREMKGLIDQVKNAKDPKATADAANAIQLATLKFEKSKFEYEKYRDKMQATAAYNAEKNEADFRKQQLDAKEPDWNSEMKKYINE